MKGFGIEVTNNLLEPKHVKGMGVAIWEYMWCLDKMTSINEKGIGLVLGGKPIKVKEIAEALGKSRFTILDNLERLQVSGYINLKRTPYGQIISVNKAKKHFGKRVGENHNSDSKRVDENVNSNVEKTSTPELVETSTVIKTVQKRQYSNTTSGVPPQDIVLIIDSFKEVNPAYGKWYGNTTQRNAIGNLLTTHGKEKLLKVITLLSTANSTQFFPTITTPLQLEEKWAALASAFLKKKSELLTKQNKYPVI